jgi:zinc transport system substrate-binding protein
MGKKIVFIILVVVILTGLAFTILFFRTNEFRGKTGKLQVVTTLFPLYDMAKSVGGNKTDVSLLLPPGVEPHSFEPKPSDVLKINEADIFIYTGDFMEPWAADILKGTTNKNLEVVNSSSGVKFLNAVFHDADEPAGSVDPHIWLDFSNAKIMVENIAAAFIKKDPANADYFRANMKNYKNELSNLDDEYRAALSNCKSNEIIYGGHYAFGYLADRYGLEYLAAQGISPDAEPTAKDLANLVDQIKKDNIKYVFYEELTSPKIAETIANETGAELLLLNAAHNVSRNQIEAGVSFFDILREDLDNLKTGLGCF